MLPDSDIVIDSDPTMFDHGNIKHGRESVKLSGNAPERFPGRDHMSGKDESERVKDVSLK